MMKSRGVCMNILDNLKSDELRAKYIQNFVNTTKDYFVELIERKTEFSDGLCYTGYLWDCLKNPQVISETEATRILQEKKNIYIMWDIHSCERIFIPNYWKYPKTSVISTEMWSDSFRENLPEDIYLFDDTFSWSVIFTHETDEKNNDFYLYVEV